MNKRKLGIGYYFIGIILMGWTASYPQFHYVHSTKSFEYTLSLLASLILIITGCSLLVWDRKILSGNIPNIIFKIFHIGLLVAITFGLLTVFFSVVWILTK
jgi:hypothetical protein